MIRVAPDTLEMQLRCNLKEVISREILSIFLGHVNKNSP